MNISVPRERRPDEFRVGLTPAAVEVLAADGHRLYVEAGAGIGAGFDDDNYAQAGATIVYSGEEAYGRADLVVKVARPTAGELAWLRLEQAVMAFWHLAAASADNQASLQQRKVTAIAYELIQADGGALPVLRSMSHIAGRMSASVAAGLLRNDRGGKGILLGGVTGVPPAEVVVLGAGEVGTQAVRAFLGQGATVYALDRDLAKLERLAGGEGRVITMMAQPVNLRKVAQFADVLVGAVLVPGRRAPVLVSREMVASMRPRSVIIDIAIDQGGCVETSRPTSHHSPTFVAEGVTHYCVPNMPGVLGRTATHALNNAAWPYIRRIAADGLDSALAADPALARGVASRGGELYAPAGAHSARPGAEAAS
jgi:alanine dehydrogenase